MHLLQPLNKTVRVPCWCQDGFSQRVRGCFFRKVSSLEREQVHQRAVPRCPIPNTSANRKAGCHSFE